MRLKQYTTLPAREGEYSCCQVLPMFFDSFVLKFLLSCHNIFKLLLTWNNDTYEQGRGRLSTIPLKISLSAELPKTLRHML